MTYETIRAFSGTFGLIFLVVMFSGAVAFALYPGNKKRFDQAAKLPFEGEGDNPKGGK
ncbi:MAG: cbb3-type cytochrome c oxidase subunit 3 [Sphingomonadales bacterium]|jgi:cytochrome c oxidase cbb3-type subunit 4